MQYISTVNKRQHDQSINESRVGVRKVILVSLSNAYAPKLPQSPNLMHIIVLSTVNFPDSNLSNSPRFQLTMLLYFELTSSIDVNAWAVCHSCFSARWGKQGCWPVQIQLCRYELDTLPGTMIPGTIGPYTTEGKLSNRD